MKRRIAWRRWLPLAGIATLALAALYVIWPAHPEDFLPRRIPWPQGHGVKIGSFERKGMRLGLDLQGGTRLLLGAQLPEDAKEGSLNDAINGTMRVLRKRVDASGVAESEITRQGASNISVQLPGLTPDQARSLLGRTALLRFCEPATERLNEVGACDDKGEWQQATGVVNGKTLALTGRFLRPTTYVGQDSLGNPTVVFEWQGDGPALSEQVTSRLIGRPLGIFLDTELLSAPTVQSTISDRGNITGMPLTRARELVVQLNSGALPVKLTVLQEQQVDATLGADSVQRSVLAGEIGLLVVMLFMTLYYRLPGVIASTALMLYTALSLAMFKLVPVTLTLAGIGAFVLSVGMAVDANILIFERMKEELRAGRSYAAAIDAGFRRAWPSIRDSNMTTLITTAILFTLGGGIQIPGLGAFDAPLVQGFALTLAVGVLVSMFSAIVVTRSLMRVLIGRWITRHPDWLGADLEGPAILNAPAAATSGDAS